MKVLLMLSRNGPPIWSCKVPGKNHTKQNTNERKVCAPSDSSFKKTDKQKEKPVSLGFII